MKAFLEIGAAVLSLVGVIIGVWGTYLLTKFTHPLGFWAFTVGVIQMFGRKLGGQGEYNKRVHDTAVILSRMRPEDKAESLHGLHWIFFGFILQTLGAVMAAVDAMWVNSVRDAASKVAGH
jgi:hypothetical protein